MEFEVVELSDSGKERRLGRLCSVDDGRYVIVALDHSLTMGPITSADNFDKLIRTVAEAGADAVIMHRGRAKRAIGQLGEMGLILHVSASTSAGVHGDAKTAVGCVDDALRLGADALSVHLNVGSDTEPTQLREIGELASACDRWQMPLLIMAYPRGPQVTDEHDPQRVAHAVSVAVDLGADLVKTNYAGSVAAMSEIVATSPIPVLVAGGAADGRSIEQIGDDAIRSGCAGLAMGRQIFESESPGEVVRSLVALAHPKRSQSVR
ncbi:2-amino-3,7-dideoxy-D-threo-hept-6-ulosonate synthase [Nocardia sp. NPDC051030]|uniref:2-amino-3,7-dideoxy-D-threo-hept-6-ulosonate synthase n=1 Tax=Nocardia sp. NPDC051030 TaxID=3155162 RepID=UPI00341DCBE5